MSAPERIYVARRVALFPDDDGDQTVYYDVCSAAHDASHVEYVLATTAAETEVKLRTENRVLRGLVQTNPEWKCPHGANVKDMGFCPFGFPGCACADDRIAVFCDDEERIVSGLRAENERLKAANEQLGMALGLLTTLVPEMEIDADNLLGMAQKIVANVERLTARVAESERDRKRLDWLAAQTKGYGHWVARNSTTGRGFRLHESEQTDCPAGDTPREAIDAAMAEKP